MTASTTPAGSSCKASDERAVRLWAVSDSVRIDPISGKVIDSNAEHSTPDHRQKNSVWDCAERTVKLHAARNEFAAFQLIIEATQWDHPVTVNGIRIRPGGSDVRESNQQSSVKTLRYEPPTGKLCQLPEGPCIGQGESAAPGSRPHHVAFFREFYTKIRKPAKGYERTSLGPGWYPDALFPHQTGLNVLPFTLPENRVPNPATYEGCQVPNQTNQAWWIEVYVPSDAPAGRYEGELEVQFLEGGSDSIAVHLEVWNFILPDQSLRSGGIENRRLSEMSEFPFEIVDYHQFLRRHRLSPLIQTFQPKYEPETGKVDWSDYDQIVGNLLDGSAFSKEAEYGYWGPGVGKPIPFLVLPFDVPRPPKGNKPRNERRFSALPGLTSTHRWPTEIPDAGPSRKHSEAIWRKVAQEIRQHFEENPTWNSTRRLIFLRGLDECYRKETRARCFEQFDYYSNLLSEVRKDGWSQFRIDGAYDLKNVESHRKSIDLWTWHTVGFDHEQAKKLAKQGVEVWFYGPMYYESKADEIYGVNSLIDLTLLVNRALGWISWKYQTGWIEWEFDVQSNRAEYTGGLQNGEGTLIYQGSSALGFFDPVMRCVILPKSDRGFRIPVPSIRLKALRRGMQDYHYCPVNDSRAGGN